RPQDFPGFPVRKTKVGNRRRPGRENRRRLGDHFGRFERATQRTLKISSSWPAQALLEDGSSGFWPCIGEARSRPRYSGLCTNRDSLERPSPADLWWDACHTGEAFLSNPPAWSAAPAKESALLAASPPAPFLSPAKRHQPGHASSP